MTGRRTELRTKAQSNVLFYIKKGEKGDNVGAAGFSYSGLLKESVVFAAKGAILFQRAVLPPAGEVSNHIERVRHSSSNLLRREESQCVIASGKPPSLAAILV